MPRPVVAKNTGVTGESLDARIRSLPVAARREAIDFIEFGGCRLPSNPCKRYGITRRMMSTMNFSKGDIILLSYPFPDLTFAANPGAGAVIA